MVKYFKGSSTVSDGGYAGGGGGGSFVYSLQPLKLVIAAGGGGGASVPFDGVPGQNKSSGSSSKGNAISHGRGGTDGQPGQRLASQQMFSAGAGAGWKGSLNDSVDKLHSGNGKSRLKVKHVY